MLAHWNYSPRVDMSLHSDTLFWFRAKQSLLFLLNAACLAEKQKYQFYSLWCDQTGAQTHDLPHSRQLSSICKSKLFTNNYTFSSMFTWKELPCLWNFIQKGFDNQYLYPLQRSCRGVYWFHHVRWSLRPSVRPSICRQILCRTITWVVFLRIF